MDHFGAGHPGDIGRMTPLECWYHLRDNTMGHKVSQMLQPASKLWGLMEEETVLSTRRQQWLKQVELLLMLSITMLT